MLTLAEGLRRAGHDVTVAHSSVPGPLAGAAQRSGVPAVALAPEGRGYTSGSLRLAAALRGYDVVHAHLTEAVAVSAAACLAIPRPLVETRHLLELAHEQRRSGVWPRASLRRWIDSRVDVTIAPSSAVLNRLSAGQQAVVVPHGIEVPDRQPRRRPAPSQWVAIGRLEADRRFDLVLDAIAAARRIEPEVTLRIVGSGDLHDELARRAAALGLGSTVTFVGDVADVSADLARATGYIVAARESFGLATLEAMAAGVPVVAVRWGGVTDLVTDGQTGVLAEPDALALGTAVAELTVNQEKAVAMGSAGWERARDAFSLQRMIDGTEDVYLGLVASTGSPRVLRTYHSGVVSSWRERDRRMRTAGADVDLVVPRRWREGSKLVAFAPAGDDFVTPASTIGRKPALFVYDPRPIVRLLRRARFDIIDVHEEPYSFAAAELLLLRRLLAPDAAVVMYTAQNIAKRYPIPFRALERHALASAAGMYACSEGAGLVARRKGFRGVLVDLPLGVDHDTVVVSSRPPGGRFVVGFAGRLVLEKGAHVLLDAARGRSWHVQIVGDGPERKRLEQRAAATSVDACFLGALESEAMPAWYAGLDVVVVPSIPTQSWDEQFCRVAAEAMAGGVPVVASQTGALPEVVGPGGRLFPAGDAAALAEVLGALDACAGGREALGQAAREWSDRYSWAEIARRHLRLYADVAR